MRKNKYLELYMAGTKRCKKGMRMCKLIKRCVTKKNHKTGRCRKGTRKCPNKVNLIDVVKRINLPTHFLFKYIFFYFIWIK